jgi:peptide deformylase
MLEILTYPDPRLNLKAVPVTKFDAELKLLVDQMLETMYAAEGCGLASIQVNIQKSITVLDVSEDASNPVILINPEIIQTEGSQTSEEGCLSFPEIRIQVTRPQKLIVKAQDLTGKEFTLTATDFFAKAIHHECEHLAGEVFIKDQSRLKQNMILKKLEKIKKQHA